MEDNSFQNQKEAANPNYSVWVSASAGTGKTTVLVSRLLRLFLSDVDPTKILCLTYTNAGAIEMQDRIFKRARSWAVINDFDLEVEIKKLFFVDIEKCDFDESEMLSLKTKARKLFSKLIDNPIPLKIYTIHAFCQSVLKRFPIEAKVSPHFSVIDDIDADKLLDEAYKDFLCKIRYSKDENAVHISNQFDYLTSILTQYTFEKLISEIIKKREDFNTLLEIYKTAEEVKTQLQKKIFSNFDNVDVNADENEYIKNIISKIPFATLKEMVSILDGYNTKTKEYENILKFLSFDNIDLQVENFDMYKYFFLTKTNEKRKSILNKSISLKYPQLSENLVREADRIEYENNFVYCLKIYRATEAILDIAFEFINIYKSLKNKNNVMDFSDLIETVNHLFHEPNISEWILYKMDGGISHILIDEAQDTSPLQWNIVDVLTEEFFTSGKTEKNIKSIFSVGDKKQSIFGFQGADVSLFEKYKKHFKNRVENGNFVFKELPLNRSFRSCKNILNLVDKILNESDIVKGVLLQNEVIEHIPHRKDYDGYVELLPLINKNENDETNYLKPPFEVVHISNSVADLSDIVAKKIKHILQNDFLPFDDNNKTEKSLRRKVEPRDIMILVQKRENAKYLVQKFNEYNIPVSGQDKLILSNNIVVEDLISLVKFTLSPYDDLSLAEVLKSPIFNLNDDDLFKLCYERNGTLYEQLNKYDEYKGIYAELSEYISLSRIKTPFLFFDYILKVKDKRKNFISRFGDIINDILNEFMQKCLYYDKEKMGKSLFDFYSWFSSSEISVKRDMEQVNNVVRIMTVHGSKGLEAPIVFLFDANIRNSSLTDKILWTDNFPIFKDTNLKSSCLKKIYLDTKDSSEEEFYRLLYVAMTRARDKLYITGWGSSEGSNEKTWYSCIKQIMQSYALEKEDEVLTKVGSDIIDNKVLYIGSEKIDADVVVENIIETKVAKHIPLYMFEKSANTIPLPENEVATSPLNYDIDEENKSLQKGKIIHKLLESFHNTSLENFKLSALKLLEKEHIDNKEKIISQIENILLNHDFDFIFGDNTFAEVEVANNNKTYRIDKLVITNNEISIIDYKTDISVPNIDNVPQKYKKQLSVYKKIIETIYPNCNVKTFILWFENAELMEII